MQRLRTALLVPAIAVLVIATFAQYPSGDTTSQWMIERSSEAGKVNLTLRLTRHNGADNVWNSVHSGDVLTSTLHGFDPALLDSNGATGKFDIARDAGTFRCEGWFAHGAGSGHFDFVPSAQYASALEQKGIGRPTADEQLRLALSNASLEFADTLKSAGYSFDVDDFIRTIDHGVSLDYVRQMAQLGYKPSSLEDLIRMRDHGVTPDYVKSIMAAGLGRMPAEEVVRMRDHGVSRDFISGLAKYGIKGLSGNDLARLRDHGVTPEFIAAMQPFGIANDPDELVRLRDHGVSPDYATDVRDAGVKVSPEDLIRMRDHGVNAAFIRDVKSAGLASVSAEDLERLRDHGVSADFIRQNGKGLSVNQIVSMHDRGETRASFMY